MKLRNILKSALQAFFLAGSLLPLSAQTVTPITKPGVEVGKQMQLYDGNLYYSTVEEKGFKIWSCDFIKKKPKLVMKSKENIGHFFLVDNTLLFTTDNGHAGQDGRLYYLDEKRRPTEIMMRNEAGPDVVPRKDKGRNLEILAFRHGFLILAPVRDMQMKYRLYRYNFKQDSAGIFLPENCFVNPGLCVSPDGKMIIANVDVVPPHPWENAKDFWNKYSQMYIIHNDDNGKLYEKWMDHAELYGAGFKYTNRTWINLYYKELKDKGNDVDHHSIFVITNPSENKGSMPKHVGEAVDTSLFVFQKKICYYFGYKGNIYLTTAFEYPTSYQLKYGKLSGHSMSDFARVAGQFPFDETMYIITRHKAATAYYHVWTVKYKFDTAEWLEAHTFFPVRHDDKLSAAMPAVSEFRTYIDTTGNPVYLANQSNIANNKLYTLGKTGAYPISPGGPATIGINDIAQGWRGNLVMKQKGAEEGTEQLVLKCKTGAGTICSPGDRYETGYDFENNGQFFFSIFSAQSKRRFNWQSDGTLEGTKRMDLGDMSLQLDFSRPFISGNTVFLMGRINDNPDTKDQLFIMEM